MNDRIIGFFLTGILIITASACEDPTNVGLGLIGEQGGAPYIVELKATSFESHAVRDITGNSTRILVGSVDDPLVGKIVSNGFIDFIRPASISANYATGQVTDAKLYLRPDYIYGDTMSTITMSLRELPQELNTSGAKSDTTIEVGEKILDFTFKANDTTIVVPLPDHWIAANETTLRSTAFDTDLHGFYIEPVSGNAVIGFTRSASLLRAFTATDSTDFLVTGTLSMIQQTTPGSLPDNRIHIQDGIGRVVSLTFALSEEDAEAFDLNRVRLKISADTLLLRENTPLHFNRPMLTQIDVYGITDDHLTLDLEASFIDDNGVFVFGSDILRNSMQLYLEGNSAFTRFELRVPPVSDNTINTQIFYGLQTDDYTPSVLLTITPLNR